MAAEEKGFKAHIKTFKLFGFDRKDVYDNGKYSLGKKITNERELNFCTEFLSLINYGF